MKFLFLFLILFFVLPATAVSAAEIKEPELNAPFTLKPGETAKVKKSEITVKVISCGKDGTIPFCEIEVQEKNAKKNLRLKDRLILVDYTIVVDNITVGAPKASDPSSGSSCTMIVRRKRVISI